MSAAQAAPEGIDPDIWATMSDEERSGITGQEYTPEELASIEKLAKVNPGPDSEDDDDDAPESTPAAAAAAAVTPKAGEGDETPAAAAATPVASDTPAAAAPATTPDPVVPVYKATLPADFDARVQAVTDKESAAWAAFEAGDKTRDELQAELAQISSERETLNRIKTKVEVAEEMSAQTTEQQWQNTIARNVAEFSKPENGGIDYKKDPAKLEDLNQFVKSLAANEANNDKSMDWFLVEAHKRVRALHGLAPQPQQQSAADAAAAAAKARKPDLKAVPQTLALVPGGDGPGDVGTEFAEVDQLEGDDLENAIAAMSPEKRARFAMGR